MIDGIADDLNVTAIVLLVNKKVSDPESKSVFDLCQPKNRKCAGSVIGIYSIMARESDFRKFGKQMSALALMGVGCRDIAWLYGCNARTVRSLLREHGVDPMPPARQVSAWFSALRRRNIEPIGDVLPHEDLLALGIVDGSANPNGTGRVDYAVVEKLISGGLGIPAIARYFGVSKAAVYEGLKRRGHTFRNQIQNSK